MGSSRALASLLATALLVAPIEGGAQPAPTQQQKVQAGDLVKKAITKSQAGDHQSAIDLYLQAYAIIPQPALLSNIGAEYQQAQKPVEAVKYFCKYLEAEPTGTNASYATAQVKALQIELKVDVDDADPCKPIVKPVSTGTGSGSGSGSAAPVVVPVTHDHDEPSKTMFYTGVAVTGVGVILTTLGVVYGFKAKSISDEITNHNVADPWPADIKAREAEGQSDQNKQIGFMITGGVVVVAGVVITVLGMHKSSTEKTVTLRPMATPSSFGLAVSGGF